jgi:hypothetical protein
MEEILSYERFCVDTILFRNENISRTTKYYTGYFTSDN